MRYRFGSPYLQPDLFGEKEINLTEVNLKEKGERMIPFMYNISKLNQRIAVCCQDTESI